MQFTPSQNLRSLAEIIDILVAMILMKTPKSEEDSLTDQINNMSPKMKAILFADLMKPKYKKVDLEVFCYKMLE